MACRDDYVWLSSSSINRPYSLASAIRLAVLGSEVPFSHLLTA